MMFTVALYLPGVGIWLLKSGLSHSCLLTICKCVSRDPDVLHRAARFTTWYVRLVGQELAPSKCVLPSTSRVVRKDMKDLVFVSGG